MQAFGRIQMKSVKADFIQRPFRALMKSFVVFLTTNVELLFLDFSQEDTAYKVKGDRPDPKSVPLQMICSTRRWMGLSSAEVPTCGLALRLFDTERIGTFKGFTFLSLAA